MAMGAHVASETSDWLFAWSNDPICCSHGDKFGFWQITRSISHLISKMFANYSAGVIIKNIWCQEGIEKILAEPFVQDFIIQRMAKISSTEWKFSRISTTTSVSLRLTGRLLYPPCDLTLCDHQPPGTFHDLQGQPPYVVKFLRKAQVFFNIAAQRRVCPWRTDHTGPKQWFGRSSSASRKPVYRSSWVD